MRSALYQGVLLWDMTVCVPNRARAKHADNLLLQNVDLKIRVAATWCNLFNIFGFLCKYNLKSPMGRRYCSTKATALNWFNFGLMKMFCMTDLFEKWLCEYIISRHDKITKTLSPKSYKKAKLQFQAIVKNSNYICILLSILEPAKQTSGIAY